MRNAASRVLDQGRSALVRQGLARRAARLGAAGLLVAAFMAIAASPALGELAHTTVTGEYGKEGPKATGLAGGCYIAYQSAEHRLYFMGENQIYGLNRTGVGAVTKLGAPFPISVTRGECNDPYLTVSQASGNIYQVPSSHEIHGFTAAGSELSSPWPVDAGGETCGVATTSSGEVWGGNYGGPSAVRFSSAGTNLGSIPLGFSDCKIAIDQSNNDLYGIHYSGGGVTQFTAASGYEPGLFFAAGGNNAGVAINGARHRIYIPDGSTVKAFDTITGELAETISFGGGGNTSSVAVDEATDTLFISDTSNGVIKEMPVAVVPKATTGEPTGNTTVSGTANPDGGGDVTECFFEFGIGSHYESTGEYESSAPCDQVTPYSSPTPVTATLPGLFGETEYHYRLVVGNANVGGRNYGGDRTITPHNVKGLFTEPADAVTRTSAELHGSFEGNGEVTKYRFEWGISGYEFQSTLTSVGSPTYPPKTFLAFSPTGLQPDNTYHFRVFAENGLGVSPGPDRTFKTLPAVQSLVTEAAGDVAPKSAVLNGSFEGDGDGTTYQFEWGTTTAYGNSTPLTSAGTPVGHQAVSAELTELELETPYHFRVVATNSLGTTEGRDETFTTLPAVASLTTEPASDVGPKSATINASFVGNGDDTKYQFEWGKSTFYGKSTPLTSAGNPIGPTPTQLSVELTGLEVETIYHFRILATNSLGTTKGADVTFTTHPAVAGVTTLAATEISQEGVTLNGSFDGNGEETEYYFELGPSIEYGVKTAETAAGSPTGTVPVSIETTEFEGFTVYHYRLVASNSFGITHGPDETFTTPPALLPGVGSAHATNIAPTTATLGAEVNPNRWATVASFDYGPTTFYGSSTIPHEVIDGTGNSDIPVSVDIAELSPGTTYHYRAVAINLAGTTHGPDQTFVTPDVPSIESKAASGLSPKSAHLPAIVVPNSRPTTYHFDYETTEGHGQSTPESASIGSDTSAHEVGVDLSGLTPGTTYQFRVVATNEVGTATGPNGSFTTPAEVTVPREERPPCKKGFMRRKGRCVKLKRHHRHHHPHRIGRHG